jgi:chromosome partitioning related protein ParA
MEMLERLEPSPHSKYRVGPVMAVIYRQDRTSDARHIADSIRQDFTKTPDNATDMADSIRQDYIRLGGRVRVLNTYVPYAKSYKEAATLRTPVHRHEPSREGTMASAYDTMHALVWELVPNLAGNFAGASGDSTHVAKGADKGVA